MKRLKSEMQQSRNYYRRLSTTQKKLLAVQAKIIKTLTCLNEPTK